MATRLAFLFPGQGAQYVGMGKQLYETSPEARKVFDEADHQLGFALSKICFSGPEEVLTETENAQVGIFVASIAALRALNTIRPSLNPTVVCGLSLGEFSALVACNSLQFEDGVQLVKKRGVLMSVASKEQPGTMASILGLSLVDCEMICKESGAELANINAPGQIVISGTKDAVQKGCELGQKKGGKTIPLKVSGAFHSNLMQSAQKGLMEALQRIEIKTPKTLFIPNVIGEPVHDPSEIKTLLGKQVTQSVQWVKTMETLKGMNVKHSFEIGPGKVLKGLAKRNEVNFQVASIETENDIQQAIKTTEEKVC